MIYLQLYWSFVKIGIFTIGGGYASLPLLYDEMVIERGFLTMTEYTDIITISQMTPGPIAINAATFVGTKTAGLLGSIFATLGFLTPPFIIVILLSYFFFKYNGIKIVSMVLSFLKPIVVGIIACVAIELFASSVIPSFAPLSIDFKALGIFVVCAYLLSAKNMSIIKVIPISAILGIILY
ncbi:MAG: chromate transporter [Clostridia bacterium]